MMKSFIYMYMNMYVIFNFIMILLMMIPFKMKKFHPMLLLLILIMMIFIIVIKMYYMFNSWISFILFLTMIGGLMIMYMYITSLANNEFFNINMKFLMMNLYKIIPILIIYYLLHKYHVYYNINMQDSWKINEFSFLMDQINMSIFYKEYNNKSTYYIMLYLYYSMIIIMNICYKFKAPLRQLMF